MPKTIAQLKDFYTIICSGALPDSKLDMLTSIISLLEKETGQDFRDTEDLHSKMDRYLSRKERPGELLIRARKKKNWTQEIMGAYLGVSRQFVKEMEKGRKPLIDKALSFVNQFSCNRSVPSATEGQFGLQARIYNKQVTPHEKGGQ